MSNATTRLSVVVSLVIVALAVTIGSSVAQAGPTPTPTPMATPTPTPTAPPTTPVIDQETETDQFLSFLRPEFFAPVGQSFVPQFRRHVGVNLFLSNDAIVYDQPPAIFTVTLRTGSVTGPIMASGSTPRYPSLSVNG